TATSRDRGPSTLPTTSTSARRLPPLQCLDPLYLFPPTIMKHPPFLSLRLAIVFQFLVNFRSDVVAFHLPGGNLYRVGGRTYTCPVTAPQLPSLDTLYFARSVPRTINIVTSTSTDSSKNNAFGTAPPAPTSLPYPRLGDVVLF
ncbi:hypothetical protein NGA_0569220, partial [Nannochloropsis gaditana CCMP526]|uniref:uncharacterized protein n=1 Tax=Nannochloropsis gaditana (strain CCMP526) TaxID=1093141 RepID=UPI00029F6F42